MTARSRTYDEYAAVLAHSDQVGVIEQITPAEARAAALAVCDKATDTADAAALLDALGLRQALRLIPTSPTKET